MSDARVTVVGNTDRKSGLVTFEVDGGKAELIVTADQVTAIIRQLSNLRAALLPEIPTNFRGQTIEAPTLPHWFVSEAKINGSRTIMMRHPGLGWIALGLTDDDATKLARLVTAPMVDDTPQGSA